MLQTRQISSFSNYPSEKYHASEGPTTDYKISTRDLMTATCVLTSYQKPLKCVDFNEMGVVIPLTTSDVQTLKYAGFKPHFTPSPNCMLQLKRM